MALTTIQSGAVAKSSVLNDNFIYLDEKISSFATNTSNKVDALSNSLTTISGNLSGTSTTVSNLSASVTELETSVEGKAKKDLSDVSLSSEFKELVLSCIAPNYSAGVNIGDNVTYTAPKAGWVIVCQRTDNADSAGYWINGLYFESSREVGNSQNAQSTCVFIGKGDKFRANYTNQIKFFPCKGA